MPAYSEILYDKQRQGVLITLNRPEAMNAATRTMIQELKSALDEAVADPEIRAIVLTGAGRGFSTGMDQGGGPGRRREIDWPYGVRAGMTASEFIDEFRGHHDLFMRIFECAKPIIGAVNGWTMGVGSWMALFTHITIASEQAVFAQPEVRHGSNTGFIWTLLAGFKDGLRYALTGDHIDAEEALRIGLVNKVVPAEQLLDQCFSIVERIALVPPETVKLNLATAIMGLQVMGFRDAWTMDGQLSAAAHTMLREQLRRPLEETRKNQGTKAYLQMRDRPFQPEPFGPRSKSRQDSQGEKQK
jgi:enoyl-CoA hydratase/carnithine racemase